MSKKQLFSYERVGMEGFRISSQDTKDTLSRLLSLIPLSILFVLLSMDKSDDVRQKKEEKHEL